MAKKPGIIPCPHCGHSPTIKKNKEGWYVAVCSRDCSFGSDILEIKKGDVEDVWLGRVLSFD